MFGRTYHVVTESDGQDSNVVTFEESNVEAEESGRPTYNQVRFDDTIDTVDKSRSRFSKRDQLRKDRVRRFQHVEAFPEDITMACAVQTNSVRNNTISKRRPVTLMVLV